MCFLYLVSYVGIIQYYYKLRLYKTLRSAIWLFLITIYTVILKKLKFKALFSRVTVATVFEYNKSVKLICFIKKYVHFNYFPKFIEM